MIPYHIKERGYVALLSTIIIGAVLLVMTVEAGQSGWYTRFIVLGQEAKVQSRGLALRCTNETLFRVMSNHNFVGEATTTHHIGSCYVYHIQKNYPLPGQIIIRIQANVNGRITNLVTEYEMNNFYLGIVPLNAPSGVSAYTPNVYPELITQIEIAALP